MPYKNEDKGFVISHNNADKECNHNKLTTLSYASGCGLVVFMLYNLKTLVKPNIVYNKKVLIIKLSYNILGIVLLVSGMSKMLYIEGFATNISQFLEMYISQLLTPYNKYVAIFICVIEIIIGLLLIMKRMKVLSAISAFILMTIFLYITGVNYLFPTELGSIEACGCFGEMLHFSAASSFYKNIFLWIIAFFLLFNYMKLYKNHISQ